MKEFIQVCLVVMSSALLSAGALAAPTANLEFREKEKRQGYFWTVTEERSFGEPINIRLPPPPVDMDQPLREYLFTDNLTREFTARYQERFGYTQAEQAHNTYSNQYDGFKRSNGTVESVSQATDAQREFGEFMVRRLAEWHMDNYVKTDKKMKPVYDLKQRLSKVEVEVSPGYSFRANYSFSGNSIDIDLKNPYVDTRARVVFGQSEFYLTLAKSITSTFVAENHTALYDGITKIVARKTLSKMVSVSLAGSTPFRPIGYSLRENLVLAGLGWVF